MGVCCNKKNTKQLDMDFIWESLPIRRMSLIEYKKRIFIISSMNLNDINSFEKIFMRDLLLHGNDESQQAIRDLFISFAHEKGIPLVIFTLLFLCRNDESIDKSFIICEMDRLLNLNLIEKDEKGFYIKKDNYVKVAGVYIDLVSRFGLSYIKKIRNIIIAANADDMYSKELQEEWLANRLKDCTEDDKVYLNHISKKEWNAMNDDIGLRKKLEDMYHENMEKKEQVIVKADASDRKINIELINKEEPVKIEEVKQEVIAEVNDEWEDDTHPDMAKFHNVL
jgi:hypothetical protein